MVSTRIITFTCLCLMHISLGLSAMQWGAFNKKEIIIGYAKIDGKKYQYYLVANRKEKNAIHVINRTNNPIVVRSGSEMTKIDKYTIISAQDKNQARTLKPGSKATFMVYHQETGIEHEIGSIESDFLLAGGNFTIMQRLSQKDEL
jgi:hypothetical protein